MYIVFIFYPNEIFNCTSITANDTIVNSTIITVKYKEKAVWCYTKLKHDCLPWESENYYNLVNGVDGDGEGKLYKDATYEQLKEMVINTIKLIKETQQDCFTREEVVRYINEQKIAKENIVEIIWMDNQKGFAVFYWSNETLYG